MMNLSDATVREIKLGDKVYVKKDKKIGIICDIVRDLKSGTETYCVEYEEDWVCGISVCDIENISDKTEPGWRWCLVGNIRENGTKQFSAGTKVYLAPPQWGDGYDNIVVIGLSKNRNRIVEVVTHLKNIENLRLRKVYSPAVLERMEMSGYLWWNNTEKSADEISSIINSASGR